MCLCPSLKRSWVPFADVHIFLNEKHSIYCMFYFSLQFVLYLKLFHKINRFVFLSLPFLLGSFITVPRILGEILSSVLDSFSSRYTHIYFPINALLGVTFISPFSGLGFLLQIIRSWT